MSVSAPVCDFGWKAPDFAAPGTDGKTYMLADIKGPRGTLVMFICNHCPYVKSAIGRIVRDAGELASHGIGTVAIMPNDTENYPEDSLPNMKEFARRNKFPFPYVIDETQQIARAYGAVCTPDFFGFNAGLELQYRGQIDDGRMNSDRVTTRDLFEAMVQVANTGQGPRHQVPSMGCSIKWRE
jgi:peroxiredoxin